VPPPFPYGTCDCNGDTNGTAYFDPNCGGGVSCVGGNTSLTACIQDCAGVWGGSAVEDNCGVCDSDSENDCLADCSGTLGGNLENDECGVCGGNNSSCTDCNGVVNGSAYVDLNCGSGAFCVGGTTGSTTCLQDCAGIWGGSAEIDDCEICGGDGPEEHYDCEGNCVAELDCQGICGGLNSATIQCQNGCIVCNPVDCNNLDSDCNSMDISPNLLPDEFGISKIFPNPFNPVTQIEYEITQYGLVTVKLFDIRGRVVEQLINEYHSSGHYNLTWDASNHASGMYFVEMIMQSGNTTISRDMKKILYLK
jgi:hypothetical protein